MDRLLKALAHELQGRGASCGTSCKNKTPFFGNDDDRADALMQRVYDSLFAAIDGQPNTKGTVYHLNMLSTTCHVYFGKMLGATPDGRLAGAPESDGTSPSHGADRNGPTAVIQSLAKMDQIKSGGTLLNMRFLPSVLQVRAGPGEAGTAHPHLFPHERPPYPVQRGGHRHPAPGPGRSGRTTATCSVRVAGYSDYFVDLDRYHQEEIISRTAQDSH